MVVVLLIRKLLSLTVGPPGFIPILVIPFCLLWVVPVWGDSSSPYEQQAVESQTQQASTKPLVFGMSAALSGSHRELGIQMRQGVQAAFDRSNRQGGVNGQQLRLVSLDDSFEPQMAIQNIHRFLKNEKPIALIGNTGTATSVVSIPMTERAAIPFIAPLSGATSIRFMDSPSRYVFHYRPSCLDEIKIIFEELVTKGDLLPCDIAFFAEGNVIGAGDLVLLDQFMDTTHDHGGIIIGFGTAGGGASSVENALADILIQNHNPRLIILAGTYPVCARFITLARKSCLQSKFLCLSSVGTIPLIQELEGQGDGVIVTQVVPNINGDSPVVKNFKEDLGKKEPEANPTFLSLEGYIAGTMVVKALEQAPVPATSEGLVESLELLNDFDLGTSTTLHLSSKDHQASDRVWVTALQGDDVISLSWDQLRERFDQRNGEF